MYQWLWRKCKLRYEQRDTTTYVLEYQKLRRPTIPSVGNDIEHLETSYTAGGNVKWCNYFGKQFAGSSNCETSSYHMTKQFHY